MYVLFAYKQDVATVACNIVACVYSLNTYQLAFMYLEVVIGHSLRYWASTAHNGNRT
jgi:hypothetical protein